MVTRAAGAPSLSRSCRVVPLARVFKSSSVICGGGGGGGGAATTTGSACGAGSGSTVFLGAAARCTGGGGGTLLGSGLGSRRTAARVDLCAAPPEAGVAGSPDATFCASCCFGAVCLSALAAALVCLSTLPRTLVIPSLIFLPAALPVTLPAAAA